MIRAACLRHGGLVSRSARHAWSSLSSSCTYVSNDDDKKENSTLPHAVVALPFSFPKRGFASTSSDSSTQINGLQSESTTPSFDDTMAKLFSESSDSTNATDAASQAADAVAASTGAPFDPTWYNLADQAIQAIHFVHDTTGATYALSIVGLTTAIRVAMVPLFVKSQQNTSRMAHMQPEMQALKQKLEALGPNPDQQTQVKYGLQMKALFKKYDCNPLRAILVPVIQMPVFMGMFFGLRKMPDFFPTELAKGGILWFHDLTVPDPTWILPVGSAMSFLVMIELGKEQMMATNPAQGQIMMNFFRFLSIAMVPIACQFSSAVLCYWVTNNTFSLLQSVAFRNAAIRKSLGIWDPPKPVPGMAQPKSIKQSVEELVKKAQGQAVSEQEKIQQHNDAIESKKKAVAIAGRNRKKRSTRRRK